MTDQGIKRKKKHFYLFKPKYNNLMPGYKGFLCFCNFREKDCVKEAINLLTQYSEEVTPKASKSEVLFDISSPEKLEDINVGMDDIEEALSNEIEAVRKASVKQFHVVESGAKNIAFIRTTVDDPVKLANAIVKDIFVTKEQKTRFLLRLIPVEITCRANIDSIRESVTTLIDKYFSNEPKTFAVVYNHRNNGNLYKENIIEEVYNMVIAKNPNHVVNLKIPNLAIIVEIIRGICSLSVVPDYMKYKKYNLHQLCGQTLPTEASVGFEHEPEDD